VVIDLAAAGLHDEDIFLAHRVPDLDAGFADREFGEVDLGRRDAKVGANGLGELGVGGAREEDDIADHLGLVNIDGGEVGQREGEGGVIVGGWKSVPQVSRTVTVVLSSSAEARLAHSIA